MTIFLEQPEEPASWRIAGGEAGLGEILRRSYQADVYTWTSPGEYLALVEAYDRRIRAIAQATGTTLDNPLRDAETEWRRQQATPQSFLASERERRPGHQQIAERRMAEFQQRISTLAQKHPEAADAIAPGRSFSDDALQIINESEGRADAAFQSRSGPLKYLAVLAGGLGAAMRDPFNVGALAFGGGPGAARTVIGRIATVASKEAAVNAAVETVLQPIIQDRRRRAGLPHGFGQAAANVAFAGLFGGTIGGALQGGGEAVGRLLSRRETSRVIEAAAGARDALPADVRGAIDAATIVRHTDDVRPADISARTHDQAVTRAEIRADDPAAAADQVVLDLEKVERIAREIVGEGSPAPARAIEPPTLTEFLIDRGGIRAQGGELRQIGATDVSRRFRGKLVTEDGLTLDRAREVAAEAGYFDDLHGTSDRAVAQSTVADLIDLVDQDVNGAPVRPRDGFRQADDVDGANRSYVEDRIAEIQTLAGPGVDDAVIARAFRLTEERGLDPDDAVVEAVMELPEPAQRGREGDALPGWSDAELEAAAAQRSTDIEGGLEDPSTVPDDLLFDATDIEGDDLLVPIGDDLVSAAELADDISRTEHLAHVVEACRL